MKSAVLALYDCTEESQLRARLQAETLTSTKARMNVRGVLLEENGHPRRYIVKAEKSSFDAEPSRSAMDQLLGLSTVTDDVVIPAPADRLLDEPMLGLALRRDGAAGPVGAHRVLLIVEGTEETETEIIAETKPTSEQTFKMVSENVRCLLSETETTMKLVAYCNMKRMTAYRLDEELALVVVSAVDRDGPGSASLSANDGNNSSVGPGSASLTVTVEHMQKLTIDKNNFLVRHMSTEWKSVLTATVPSQSLKRVSAYAADYWTQPKLKHLQSEPATPKEHPRGAD